jgi:hypothetical protein
MLLALLYWLDYFQLTYVKDLKSILKCYLEIFFSELWKDTDVSQGSQCQDLCEGYISMRNVLYYARKWLQIREC